VNLIPESPVAIVGSRDFPDLDMVRAFVRSLPKDACVVSGGARGVDQAAESEAKKCNLAVASYKPEKDGNEYRIRLYEWNPRGTMEATVGFAATFARAAHMRNQMIVDRCVSESGCVVAFRSVGKSNGTDSTVTKAEAAGILFAVYTPDSVTPSP
jgi:hypothetical protein